jgi:hypothetical protein
MRKEKEKKAYNDLLILSFSVLLSGNKVIWTNPDFYLTSNESS